MHSNAAHLDILERIDTYFVHIIFTLYSHDVIDFTLYIIHIPNIIEISLQAWHHYHKILLIAYEIMNIVPTQYKVIFIINTYIYMSDEDEKTLTDMVYNEWYQKLFYDSGRCTIGQGGLSKRIRVSAHGPLKFAPLRSTLTPTIQFF